MNTSIPTMKVNVICLCQGVRALKLPKLFLHNNFLSSTSIIIFIDFVLGSRGFLFFKWRPKISTYCLQTHHIVILTLFPAMYIYLNFHPLEVVSLVATSIHNLKCSFLLILRPKIYKFLMFKELFHSQ